MNILYVQKHLNSNIIKADKGNYLHLIGIHTDLTANEFFDNCTADGEEQLTDENFDFHKSGRSEKSVKGSVREKNATISKT